MMKTMLKMTGLCCCLVWGAGCAHKTVQKNAAWSPTPAKADASVMDRFRALEGTWVSTYDMPEWPPQEVHYETIAADSAVVETIFDGQPHEMMTVFHLDGEELHCTHYCAAQNQPRLIAETITSDRVVFATADVSNLASPDAMYMGAAEFTFIDEDHIEVSWTSFEHGKQGETIHVTSERKK